MKAKRVLKIAVDIYIILAFVFLILYEFTDVFQWLK